MQITETAEIHSIIHKFLPAAHCFPQVSLPYNSAILALTVAHLFCKPFFHISSQTATILSLFLNLVGRLCHPFVLKVQKQSVIRVSSFVYKQTYLETWALVIFCDFCSVSVKEMSPTPVRASLTCFLEHIFIDDFNLFSNIYSIALQSHICHTVELINK